MLEHGRVGQHTHSEGETSDDNKNTHANLLMGLESIISI